MQGNEMFLKGISMAPTLSCCQDLHGEALWRVPGICNICAHLLVWVGHVFCETLRRWPIGLADVFLEVAGVGDEVD